MDDDVKFKDPIQDTMKKIYPLLSGLGPEIQGAVLADLFAMYLAGHVGPDSKQVQTVRDQILMRWLDTVRELVPINERMILARMKAESH